MGRESDGRLLEKSMTIGAIGRTAAISINPALLVALFSYIGGWRGVVACFAMFAAIGLILWASEQP